MHSISKAPLSFDDIHDIIAQGKKIELSEEVCSAIEKCRSYLDDKVARTVAPIYGVNTGFGSLCNHSISDKDLSQLQANLVMSHACGTGEEVPSEIVKLMLLLKIQSLSYGHSGVQLITVQRLVDMFNHNILPIVYQQGSLGASGDLAPLAHLALPLLGMGEVDYLEDRLSGNSLLKKMSWEPITLKSKEGLALLNGTQFMSAYGTWSILQSQKLDYLADVIGTLSLEAFDGRIEPFDALIHFARPHNGQIKTAARIREFLEGSELIVRDKKHVQDPYSFRCIPQVHGASKQAIKHVCDMIETEINSVTDNPNVFVEADKIISGGNFHGQPIAIPMDYLAIAIHELANISERRIYQLVCGLRGLPSYLVANPGLNSGFMIPQYTAASIVSQSKMLCTPASADSIVSSNGQEDHVSMGANAATKLFRVIENTERVLAIELMNAAQALEFRKEKTSPFLQMFLASYRQEVAFVQDDRYLKDDIDKSISFLKNLAIDTSLY